MARGRFISESVATDARLNSLSVEAELVYLMTVPHLDRDGLISGDPDVLWGKVCPKRRLFIDRIAVFIQEWAKAGLVTMYDSDEGPVLWFGGFAKNQVGLRYDRETPSKFPAPPGYIFGTDGIVVSPPPPDIPDPETHPNPPDLSDVDSLPQVSGTLPEASGNCLAQWQVEDQDQLEVKDQGKAEAEGATPSAAAVLDPDAARVWEAWNANMPGTKSPVIADGVNALLDEYSAAEIIEAIAIACRRHKRSLGYIEGILIKGVFEKPQITTGADYRPGRSTNGGVAAVLGYMEEKGMRNGRN